MAEATQEPEKKDPSKDLTTITFERGIVPRNTHELTRTAKFLLDSGLAPKSLDTWQKIAVAMAMCLEVGRPIMLGIQDMAVINGKVGTYGDAVLAQVRGSGLLEEFEEWETGTPYADDWTFHCKVKRQGFKERISTWSWKDSKRAGFDDPKMRDGRKDTFTPWRRFTRRMMQFKARNFPLRDEFGDIIKGMRIVEDLHDHVDLEPQGNGTFAINPETKAPAPNFDELVRPEGTDEASLARFLALCAKQFKKGMDEVKAEAAQDPDSFWPQFQKWAKTQPEQEQVQPPESVTEEITLYCKAKNLRKPGFADWVHKNLDRILEAPESDLVKLKAKWIELYDEPWPLDKKTGTSSAKENDGEDWNGLIQCPNMNNENIAKARCKTCEKREGCPALEPKKVE